MKILEKIISLVVNIEIKFLALQSDFQTCYNDCKKSSGYLPYVSEVRDKNLIIKTEYQSQASCIPILVCGIRYAS